MDIKLYLLAQRTAELFSTPVERTAAALFVENVSIIIFMGSFRETLICERKASQKANLTV